MRRGNTAANRNAEEVTIEKEIVGYYAALERRWYCEACKWFGKGSEAEVGDVESMAFQITGVTTLDCPRCHATLTRLRLGDPDDILAHRDRVSDEDVQYAETRKRLQERWDAHHLSDPAQLPDVADETFTVTWDCSVEDGLWVYRLSVGDRVLWQEVALGPNVLFLGPFRFAEVAPLLVARYGERVRDLVPSEGTLGRWSADEWDDLWTYRNRFIVADDLWQIRKRVFGPHVPRPRRSKLPL